LSHWVKKRIIYLRYFCTNAGKGESYNIPRDVILSPEQFKELNEGTPGGLIQKQLFNFSDEKLKQ
jgi:hypothetical protein